MKQLFLQLLFTCFCNSFAFSQLCVVSNDSLKGNYVGECKDGKANGQGTATGVDSYTGGFRNGKPEGDGKYSWKNGDWYEGSWMDGFQDGKGVMHKQDRPDTLVVLRGFWKKGLYVGAYEKPYIIHSTSTNITSMDIRKTKGSENSITIYVKNVTSGASNITHLSLPKTRLVNIQVLKGKYEFQIPDENISLTYNKYVFKDVSFPFRAVLSFDIEAGYTIGEQIELELLENCNWLINVQIDN